MLIVLSWCGKCSETEFPELRPIFYRLLMIKLRQRAWIREETVVNKTLPARSLAIDATFHAFGRHKLAFCVALLSWTKMANQRARNVPSIVETGNGPYPLG